MKKCLVLVVLSLNVFWAAAQNIVKAEYFIDTDPGIGVATDVPVTAATSITDQAFSISLSSLSDGLHFLNFRVKDANGVWSITERTPFYRLTLPTGSTPAVNIIKAEYFVDTDPGAGAATNIPITSGLSITDLPLAVNLSSLSDGLHQLYVRFKDANGVWSITERTPFYRLTLPTGSTPPAVNIIKAEYFVDTDPGAGAATNIPITSGLSITNLPLAVNLSSLSDGLHQLYVRFKDANGVWSITERTPFYRLTLPTGSTSPAVNVTKAEYFIDTDPGAGAATNIPITSGLSISDLPLAVNLSSLSDGLHQLYVRFKDANGVWSITERTPFYRLTLPTGSTPPAVNIIKAEYFVDTDPGAGAATNIPITSGLSITNLLLPVNVSALAEGTHKLCVRFKDANGIWSVTESTSFSVCNGAVPTASTATSITTSGFTANWATASLATSYQLEVSADDFATFVSGFNPKLINAPVTNAAVSGLNPATLYKYRVRAFRTCTSVNSATISVSVPVATPASQPTNMVFLAPGSNDVSIQFDPPSPLPTGYLVVRRAGSYTTFVPSVNVNYTVNQNVGNGVVVHSDLQPLLADVGLTPNTNYFYTVFAFNRLNGFTSYLTTLPLKGNVFTLASEPASQPTNLQFANLTSSSYTVQFTAAAGNPGGYLVLRKTGAEPASVPVDGTSYTSTVDTDIIAYQGSGLSFNEAGLAENTNYFYAVYAYNGSGTSINYQALNPLRGDILTPLTPPATPTNLQFSNVTPTSITVSYTRPTNTPAGYVVVRKQGAASTFAPELNTSYTTGAVSDGIIVYAGPNTSFTDNGLIGSTVYFYSVFAFNQTGQLISYQTTQPLVGSQSTFTGEPTAQPSGITFSSITTTSLNLSFTAASPSSAGYLVLRGTANPSTPPTDGTAYIAANTIVNGTVVYAGSNTSQILDSPLLPGTTYFYQVFSFNGIGTATNYLTTVTAANTGSTITLPIATTIQSATAIGQTSFTANWTVVTGAVSYQLDVSTDNFGTFVSGYNSKNVSGNSDVVSGLNAGVTYQYQVRAVNAIGGISSNSNPVGSQLTTPPTPVGLVITNTEQTQFTITWTPSQSATEYLLYVSENASFSPLFSGYGPKTIALATETVNGLLPGNTYHVKVQAKNNGGGATSPESSSASKLLKPATPLAIDAVNVFSSSFKAKWEAANGATEYEIDVSLLNNFSTHVTGYPKNVGNVLEEPVTGLQSTATYFYFVRAKNATGNSPYGNIVSVITDNPGVGSDINITEPIICPDLESSQSSINISAQVNNGNGTKTVELFHRKLADEGSYTSIAMNFNASTSKYDASVPSSAFDEMGIEFKIRAQDLSGTVQTVLYYCYKSFSASNSPTIPFAPGFTGKTSTYQMFSIPYELDDKTFAGIFNELGDYDKAKWRLFRYDGVAEKYLEYKAGLPNSIELGKGYWFNAANDLSEAIQIGSGGVNQANQSEPFTLSFNRGWNQIGNPYPFNIDWPTIQTTNPSAGLGGLKLFEAGDYKDKTVLAKWKGAFVFSDNGGLVSFPVLSKTNEPGRISQNDLPLALDEEIWQLPLTLLLNDLVQVSAIGMHPEAKLSKDKFDDITVPRFIDHLEMNTVHPEFFAPNFSTDMVSTGDQQEWLFTLSSNMEGPAQLVWNQQELAKSASQLILIDLTDQVWVDMKTTAHYSFSWKEGRQLKVLYSRDGEINPGLSLLGQAFPNPFGSDVTIPVLVENEIVEVQVFDLLGKKVKTISGRFLTSGPHTLTWDGRDEQGYELSSGVLLYKMSGTRQSKRMIKQ